MAADVWVLAVGSDDAPSEALLESIGEARRLADGSGSRVVALRFGETSGAFAARLGEFGADALAVIELPGPEGAHVEHVAAALGAAIERQAPSLVLVPGTALGHDLGVRTALAAGCRYFADCIRLELPGDGRVRAERPVRGGSYQANEIADAPVVAGVRRGVVGLGAAAKRPAPPVEKRAVETELPPVRLVDGGLRRGDPRNVDLSEADVVVSGGRGLGGPEGFALLAELADLLGGTIGASRAAVDAGWVPYERQVGQTGKSVQPKLYLACGISGAIQHLAGIGEGGALIALTLDESAPILARADVGVVADLHEVLPALIEELRRRRDAPQAEARV